MAFEMLQAVVGTAVIDADFRRSILNGSRHGAIARFELSHEEMGAVMSIRAETLEEFAGQLDQWIMKKENRLEPLALDLPELPLIGPREAKSQRAAAPLEQGAELSAFMTTSALGPA
jgi:hypothetical protein